MILGWKVLICALVALGNLHDSLGGTVFTSRQKKLSPRKENIGCVNRCGERGWLQDNREIQG